MCGIFGYADYQRKLDQKEIANILIKGLEKMEYRGYDSAGLYILSDSENVHHRAVGRVMNLDSKIKSSNSCCANENKNEKSCKHKNKEYIGIAHTRWATHGECCEQNTHPIKSDKDGKFFVVHNGIISNYKKLKDMLTNAGYQFETQTDTEVASKLALYYHTENPDLSFIEIVKEVIKSCEGTYAFLFASPLFPGVLIAAKHAAPLIIGISNGNPSILTSGKSNENIFDMKIKKDDKVIISSDITAIIEHSRNVIYLADGDIACVTKGNLTIHSKLNTKKEVMTINSNLNEALKGNYKHFMLKEIHEQKDSILNTLRNRVDFDKKTINLNSLSKHLEKISKCSRIIFVACGTSYNSAIATKKIFEELTGKPTSVDIASNFLDIAPIIKKDDCVFFISQSGETADTISAINYCKKFNATLIGITNTPTSTIARETDCFLTVNAGIEKGVASTKAYTSQYMCIILIALYISQKVYEIESKDKVDQNNSSVKINDSKEKVKNLDTNHIKNISNNSQSHKTIKNQKSSIKKNDIEYCEKIKKRRDEIIEAMVELPLQIQKTLDVPVEKLIEQINKRDSLIVIGRGFQGATCIEGALKVKELSYVHAEGILAGELKHGPLALVSKDQNIVVIIANDEFCDKSHSAYEQIKARGAIPMVICTEDISDKYDSCVAVPKTIDCLQGILMVIPFQIISYNLSIKKGYDPDFPRNLAKSVTVE